MLSISKLHRRRYRLCPGETISVRQLQDKQSYNDSGYYENE